MERKFKEINMKQIILKYQDFLNIDESVLTKSESEKYSKIQVVKDVKAIHTKIFGDGERIYIPFDFSHLASLDKSKTQKRVEYILSKNGYEIVSYEQNQCKKVNDSRLTSIAKVLQSKNVNKPDLAVDYGQDVEKSRNLEPIDDMYVCISKNSDDIASMSTGRSWTSCQNLRGGSLNHFVAKDLKQGSIIAYLIKSTDREIEDPESRILIKPFINQEDSKDIVLLPSTVSYYRTKGKGNSKKEKYPNFYKFLMSWVKMVQPDMDGTYKMQEDVYQDGSTTTKLKKDLTPEELERVEDPQNQEDLKLAFDYYDLNFSKCKFNDDGLIEYNGSLKISGDFNRLPKLFKFIKIIKGNLDLSECPRLKTFKNLENLRSVSNIKIYYYNDKPLINKIDGLDNLESVFIEDENIRNQWIETKYPDWKERIENPKSVVDFGLLQNVDEFAKKLDLSKIKFDTDGLVIYDGDIDFSYNDGLKEFPKWMKLFKEIGGTLYCSRTSITSFKGLENLRSIGGELNCSKTSITGFTGLNNLKEIRGGLFCAETSITSFKGLENLESIGGSLYCYYTPLKSFNGLGNLKSIGTYLDCRETSITDFTGLESLRSIGTYLDCYKNSITSFKGLKNLESIGSYLDCSGTSITSFNGLENLKSIGEFLDCRETSITSFNGLEKCEINPYNIEPSSMRQKYKVWKETLKQS